jgi:hypothetical protein
LLLMKFPASSRNGLKRIGNVSNDFNYFIPTLTGFQTLSGFLHFTSIAFNRFISAFYLIVVVNSKNSKLKELDELSKITINASFDNLNCNFVQWITTQIEKNI